MQVSAVTSHPYTDAERRVSRDTFAQLKCNLLSRWALCILFACVYCAVRVGNTSRTQCPARIRHGAQMPSRTAEETSLTASTMRRRRLANAAGRVCLRGDRATPMRKGERVRQLEEALAPSATLRCA